jgi:hypothetical protein
MWHSRLKHHHVSWELLNEELANQDCKHKSEGIGLGEQETTLHEQGEAQLPSRRI